MLSVHKKGLQLHNLRVFFSNGEVCDVAVRNYIAAESYTRAIDLPGNRRVINKVVFWYQTSGRRRGQALVKLWGIR